MAVERVDCARDPRAAPYRELRDGDLLRASGLFAAEGRLIVRRVIDDGRFSLHSLLVNDAALRDLGPAIGRLGAEVPVLVCRPEAIVELAGFHLHRGCLALVHRPPPAPVDAIVAASPTLVVLEAVANADNVGGVFRNAAAFGAGAVLLSPTCCDPLYRKAIRTSMGAALLVPFARAGDDDWPAALVRVRAAGFTIVALTPREPSETLNGFAARRDDGSRIALIAGAEGTGLTAAVEAAADHRVRIPISDRVDSLNLAVAVGIALSRLRSG